MYKDRTVRITVTGPAQNTINTKQIDPSLGVLCEAVGRAVFYLVFLGLKSRNTSSSCNVCFWAKPR